MKDVNKNVSFIISNEVLNVHILYFLKLKCVFQPYSFLFWADFKRTLSVISNELPCNNDVIFNIFYQSPNLINLSRVLNQPKAGFN